jgi:hypothetical protein
VYGVLEWGWRTKLCDVADQPPRSGPYSRKCLEVVFSETASNRSHEGLRASMVWEEGRCLSAPALF